MTEIRNYTLNFGSGRSAAPSLTCMRKLASAEIQGVIAVAALARGCR